METANRRHQSTTNLEHIVVEEEPDQPVGFLHCAIPGYGRTRDRRFMDVAEPDALAGWRPSGKQGLDSALASLGRALVHNDDLTRRVV